MDIDRVNRIATLVATVALLPLPARSLSAQALVTPSAVHSGFFGGGFGLGLGSAHLSCGQGCSSNSANGLSGNSRIGGTIKPHFRVGLVTNGWVHSENGVDSQVGPSQAQSISSPSVHGNFLILAHCCDDSFFESPLR